jgi:AcrR family transcriptional regulator
MATHTETSAPTRTPLTRERVLRAAIDLADRAGIESLSMRKLAQELRVEAMSLYNHVRDKDDILDGIVDVVVGEIEVYPGGGNWKTSMRQQVIAARKVLLRHPWAPRVIESRTSRNPAMVSYMDSVIKLLRHGGFSVDLAHHALHVLGSRILGFTQDLFDDSAERSPGPEMAALFARELAAKYPYAAEMAMSVSHDGGLGGCDDDVDFEFGLDLILDGLDRLRDTAGRRRRRSRTSAAPP